MSKHRVESQFLVDLSTVEQQLFAGGQSNFMPFDQMPNVLVNGFPNAASLNPVGSTGTENTDEKIISHHHSDGTVLY